MKRPIGGALLFVSETSTSLMQSVYASPASPAPLPAGSACVDGLVPSAVQLQRKVLPAHEVYWYHVLGAPVTALRGDVVHILLLSSAALYVLLPEHSVPLMVLPMHCVERLEEMPFQATDSSVMLAFFLYPAEAHHLGVPSCMQYSLGADASHILISMYEQLIICSACMPP